MRFTKMQGIGNDFVMVNALGPDGEQVLRDAQDRAVLICDRKFGVGADGVIAVLPSRLAHFRMRMFNPDGSESEMCGNGIRCFAKYVYDDGLTKDTVLNIETGAGLLSTKSQLKGGKVDLVKVEMGCAHLDREDIPVKLDDKKAGPVISEPLKVEGKRYEITCVSMGNPHCVVFVDNLEHFPVTKIGPSFEHHRAFPKRTNTEFVQVLNREEIAMRVWERGAGETLACGTGACAAAVASVLNNKTLRKVTVHLAGGDLLIEISSEFRVMMTGPAKTVFQGEI